MIIIGVIGLAIDQLFKLVEHRFFIWRGLDR
jgi:ABC-type nitrate/sulfonate/bicarbonate transport system permease component